MPIYTHTEVHNAANQCEHQHKVNAVAACLGMNSMCSTTGSQTHRSNDYACLCLTHSDMHAWPCGHTVSKTDLVRFDDKVCTSLLFQFFWEQYVVDLKVLLICRLIRQVLLASLQHVLHLQWAGSSPHALTTEKNFLGDTSSEQAQAKCRWCVSRRMTCNTSCTHKSWSRFISFMQPVVLPAPCSAVAKESVYNGPVLINMAALLCCLRQQFLCWSGELLHSTMVWRGCTNSVEAAATVS